MHTILPVCILRSQPSEKRGRPSRAPLSVWLMSVQYEEFFEGSCECYFEICDAEKVEVAMYGVSLGAVDDNLMDG